METLTYVFSFIAVVAFVAYFWLKSEKWFAILWAVSAFFAIWCIYVGVFGISLAETPEDKAFATCSLVWGTVIFFSLVATGLNRIRLFKE